MASTLDQQRRFAIEYRGRQLSLGHALPHGTESAQKAEGPKLFQTGESSYPS